MLILNGFSVNVVALNLKVDCGPLQLTQYSFAGTSFHDIASVVDGHCCEAVVFGGKTIIGNKGNEE